MSASLSSNPLDPDRQGDIDPVTGLPESGPVPASGSADAVVMVPVAIPVAVPVPVDAAEVWSGTVIDPVPATVDDIAALVLAVPDVVRLHAGRFGEVATYLPGRRVTGIKLGVDAVEVHVVIAGHTPVRQTAQLIHAAVATLVATPVHVYVEDVAGA